MRALVSWLQDFVEIPESPAQLAEALTLAGLAVDTVETIDGDAVLELDITSNRPDAANHLGLAREIAAIYGRPLKRPRIELVEDVRPAAEYASIQVEAGTCARAMSAGCCWASRSNLRRTGCGAGWSCAAFARSTTSPT